MNPDWLPTLVSYAAATLVLWAALLRVGRGVRLPVTGARGTLVAGVLALGLALTPVSGFPLARFVAGLGWTPCVPLQALLADGVWRAFRGEGWLRPADHQIAWVWGAAAGLALYPSALGLGRFDLYSLGWGPSVLGAAVLLLTAGLLWRGCRFGVVLVLSTAAWQLGVFESANYWDYLVDPVFAVASLGALLLHARPRREQRTAN